MRVDDPRHGTEAGHEQHCRDDEQPCDPCHDAKLKAGRRRSKRKTMGYVYTVDAGAARERLSTWRNGGATYGQIADHVGIEESRIWEVLNNPAPVVYTRTANAILNANGWPVTTAGLTRRVRALCRLGWSIPRIAAACGVGHDTILDIRKRRPEFASRRVRDAIVKGYAASYMTLPEATDDRQLAGITRARNYAEAQGWSPPLAWDNIDDPNERPRGSRDERPSASCVDHAVVVRMLAGERMEHTASERREVVAHLWRLGLGAESIAQRCGLAEHNVDMDIRRLGLRRAS